MDKPGSFAMRVRQLCRRVSAVCWGTATSPTPAAEMRLDGIKIHIPVYQLGHAGETFFIELLTGPALAVPSMNGEWGTLSNLDF